MTDESRPGGLGSAPIGDLQSMSGKWPYGKISPLQSEATAAFNRRRADVVKSDSGKSVLVLVRHADANDSVPIGRVSETDKPMSLLGVAVLGGECDG